jgi:hypothetical protein
MDFPGQARHRKQGEVTSEPMPCKAAFETCATACTTAYRNLLIGATDPSVICAETIAIGLPAFPTVCASSVVANPTYRPASHCQKCQYRRTAFGHSILGSVLSGKIVSRPAPVRAKSIPAEARTKVLQARLICGG